MFDPYQQQALYVSMWAACLHNLERPALPHKVRFIRGSDEEHGNYLMCMVLGPDRAEEPGEIWGCVKYTNGIEMMPARVRPEQREALMEIFED